MTTTDAAYPDLQLRSWTETDPVARRAIIDELWAPDGVLTVSSLGEAITGVDAIADHIGRVHDDLIVGKGLTFRYDQHLTSGDTLLLRWSMTAPNGTVVGRGVDTVERDDAGRATTVRMFMGVD